MYRLAFAGVLLLAAPRATAGQALSSWADITPDAATIRLPAAWVAAHADLGAWGLSWIEGGAHPRPGLAVRSGMIIGLPKAEGALSDRLRRATIRYYGPEPCGMEACIVVSDPAPVRATLENDMVVISVRSGPALNSLWQSRPERLDLHAPGAPAPDRAIGWIRVHYAP